MQKEMKNKNCIFCEIVDKKRKSLIIDENENSICFLDLNPMEKGHCLVITKKCCKNILDLTKKEIISINELTKRVCVSLQKKIGSKGFNIINNFNKVAGQVIEHYHLHIIPKYQEKYGFN